MKNIIYFVLIFSYSLVHGQKNSLKVGDSPFTINSKAAFEIESKSKGFLPPRMNSAERDNIQTPPEGLTLYNTDNKSLEVNNGTSFRGTTASGFYFFRKDFTDPLYNFSDNIENGFFVSDPFINNEFFTITKSPSVFTIVAPSDGWYQVSINYVFNASAWSSTDTCYTGLYVNNILKGRVDHNPPSGTRFISFSCVTAVPLLKNDVLKPVVYFFSNGGNKSISNCSISIVKL